MEKQVTKDASGSKGKSKKEAEPWRCEENRLRYERNKQELILTESEEEALGSDLEEFLWTYNDDTPYEEYEDALQKGTEEQVQKATANLLAYITEQHKKLDAGASEVKPSSK
jgi:predicted Zn-dependent peptidase